ncbi:MAG TPA: hypothetical protein VF427_10420 [Noviherbaspirillum sp.]
MIARVLPGLLFVNVDLDKFLQFIPLPQVHGVAKPVLLPPSEEIAFYAADNDAHRQAECG